MTMTLSQTTLSTLIDAMFPEPWLTVEIDVDRCDYLSNLIGTLQDRADPENPAIALVRSWFAVAHGAEAFEEGLLKMLCDSEAVIREHFPDEHRSLGMNLAAQGCHIWFLREKSDAIRLLAEALKLMMTCRLTLEADLLKVCEVLADCLSEIGYIDDALFVLYLGQPYVAASYEQDEFLAAQFEEFREQFVQEFGDVCLPESAFMLDTLRLPRRVLVQQSQSAGAISF